MIPREAADLLRRRRAFEIVAASSGGIMGRTPDYLNVTFACFAGRADVWARRGNDAGAANIVAYQRLMRDADLSTTHALMNPTVDKRWRRPSRPRARSRCTRSRDTAAGIVVRGARMLATLAPFADELLIYPGSRHPPAGRPLRALLRDPGGDAGLRFICRDSFAKRRNAFDYPLSSRFDEQDAFVIFDDVEVPADRVFLDGDTIGYSEVITDTGWRGHIMHQAFTRAPRSCPSRSASGT